MSKLLLTTDRLPEGMAIAEVYNMIQYTGTIEVSERGVVVGLYERKRADHQDIIDNFSACAPSDADAIIGIQLSTTTQTFGELTYQYITYIGTPVTLATE